MQLEVMKEDFKAPTTSPKRRDPPRQHPGDGAGGGFWKVWEAHGVGVEHRAERRWSCWRGSFSAADLEGETHDIGGFFLSLEGVFWEGMNPSSSGALWTLPNNFAVFYLLGGLTAG